MIILYNPKDGEIFYAIKTSEIPTFAHSTNIPLETAEIPDEGNELQTVRAEVVKHQGRKNEAGKGRFFVDISTNPLTLVERENWKEYIAEQ